MFYLVRNNTALYEIPHSELEYEFEKLTPQERKAGYKVLFEHNGYNWEILQLAGHIALASRVTFQGESWAELFQFVKKTYDWDSQILDGNYMPRIRKSVGLGA